MPTYKPTKSDRVRILTLDLIADWQPFADPLPEPRSDFDWRYYGTVTRNGVTSALAWRSGNYGFGLGAHVTDCGLWDRIRITNILFFEKPPGLNDAPIFTYGGSMRASEPRETS